MAYDSNNFWLDTALVSTNLIYFFIRIINSFFNGKYHVDAKRGLGLKKNGEEVFYYGEPGATDTANGKHSKDHYKSIVKAINDNIDDNTEAPRLTRFHLTRNSLQHGFGLGTKKFI